MACSGARGFFKGIKDAGAQDKKKRKEQLTDSFQISNLGQDENEAFGDDDADKNSGHRHPVVYLTTYGR